MYARLASNSDVLKRDDRRSDAVLESSDAAWVDLFALAVSEENAAGGRIVTALPTVRLASFRRCSTIIGISWIMRMRMVW